VGAKNRKESSKEEEEEEGEEEEDTLESAHCPMGVGEYATPLAKNLLPFTMRSLPVEKRISGGERKRWWLGWRRRWRRWRRRWWKEGRRPQNKKRNSNII